MKYFKILLLALWVVSVTLFIIGGLTPLEFRSQIVAYLSFFIAINGTFMLRFLLSDYVRLKATTIIIVLIISISAAVTYSFIPGTNDKWKTQEILYRKKDSRENVISYQMIKEGNSHFDHRIVKVTRVTPFFNWIVEINNLEPGDDWEKVNEYVNELNMDKDSFPK